ncbi:hypothetical protein GGR50DRAFT_645077 [Xylaria sp. CBS 124048]|nr:hypothetical protein GGR50DRAFT_645077 [Xylaria sp. CBS 124048]
MRVVAATLLPAVSTLLKSTATTIFEKHSPKKIHPDLIEHELVGPPSRYSSLPPPIQTRRAANQGRQPRTWITAGHPALASQEISHFQVLTTTVPPVHRTEKLATRNHTH